MKKSTTMLLLLCAICFAQTALATAGTTNPLTTEVTGEVTVLRGSTLAKKLAWLDRSAESHNTYIIEVNANENIAPHTFEYNGAINITVILRGDSENRTIRLKTHGNMFVVKQNVTFILDNNITLMGHNGNTDRVVNVNGGTLKMNKGATITNNSGGGVVVRGGIFEMNGGIISNNITPPSDPYGGGVRVFSATFEMNGGTISGNNAINNGGGVDVDSGIFKMNGGTISSNNAREWGGGVSINSRQTFNMRGGIITGNTAGVCGGGVYIHYVNFTKSGGIITSYKNDPINGNVVKDEDGVIARKGHAVYQNENKRKETTALPDDKLFCNNDNCTGAWDD